VAAFLEREALKARLLALLCKQRDYEAEARKASERQRALPEWIVLRRRTRTDIVGGSPSGFVLVPALLPFNCVLDEVFDI
jgi:hypothetical protein